MLEDVVYQYNLQGRLSKVNTTPYIGGAVDTPNISVTSYTYNSAGIRVQKDVDGTVTDYLIDSYNHTGYAQVLEETTGNSRIQYTLGDDVISQTESTFATVWTASGTEYLLYDGHGSTRQLIDNSSPAIVVDDYSYDAYGVMLHNGTEPSPQTSMLYAGEQYDSNLSMYYNRARYYNQSNGTFNRVDPYAGNNSDPQSLHKYAYVHNNPVMGIDPSGLFSLVSNISSISIMALTSGIISGVMNTTTVLLKGGGVWNALKSGGTHFLSSAAGTFISLLLLPLAGPLAFGIGSATATYLQLFFENGYNGMFTSKEWWISMTASFVVGLALGFFAADSASYLKDKIAKTLDGLPTVWQSLGQLQFGQGVWTPKLVGLGLKQTSATEGTWYTYYKIGNSGLILACPEHSRRIFFSAFLLFLSASSPPACRVEVKRRRIMVNNIF